MTWLEIALAVAAQLFVAGAIYGGIRADLRALHTRVQFTHERAEHAHERIDSMLIRKG